MAVRMNVSGRYGTHLPVLIKALEKTSGDVLELGMGVFSTPYLHYKCILDDRKLVSYENYRDWMNFFIKYGYKHPNHEIHFVDKYEDARIDDKTWSVALIDQTPDSSRVETIKRLASLVEYIVIHDSNGRYNKIYHYDTIYPLFKFHTVWDQDSNHAAVLSNFTNLDDFWK